MPDDEQKQRGQGAAARQEQPMLEQLEAKRQSPELSGKIGQQAGALQQIRHGLASFVENTLCAFYQNELSA